MLARELIARLAAGATLTQEETTWAFDWMTSGKAMPSQVGALLMALRIRGESVEEIAGAAASMRTKMIPVSAPSEAMDLVGTGGDGLHSQNISTCASFIVAGAGVKVAKHGNRALSSRCGSADVLTRLGVNVDIGPELVTRCISEAGIGFMFAPAYHPVTRIVGPVRAELGIRTIFNLLGPLLNPAGVSHHLIGVYSIHWVEAMAHVLHRLGSLRAFVVCGSDGMDEITTTGPTTVASLDRGAVRTFEVSPDDVGLPTVSPETLVGADAESNARALRAVLDGQHSPYRDVAMFNAAAAFVVSERVSDLPSGMQLARESIDSGAAAHRLARLISVSNCRTSERVAE